MPIRIYTLAKQFKIDFRVAFDICKQLGMSGKGSALASLTDEEAATLKAHLVKNARILSKTQADYWGQERQGAEQVSELAAGGTSVAPSALSSPSAVALGGHHDALPPGAGVSLTTGVSLTETDESRSRPLPGGTPNPPKADLVLPRELLPPRNPAPRAAPADHGAAALPPGGASLDIGGGAQTGETDRMQQPPGETWTDFDPERLAPERFAALGLHIPEGTLECIVTSLLQRRHLLLWGAPGTGKTEIAKAIPRLLFGEEEQEPYLIATANASWTSYEVIGGLALMEGRTVFRPGIFTLSVQRSIERSGRFWLIIDEINRADIDRAMGAMFTALEDFSLWVPEEGGSPKMRILGVPERFRVIATMNTVDKNNLFPLSVALMRRFAMIEIPPVSDFNEQERLIQEKCTAFLQKVIAVPAERASEIVNSPAFVKTRTAVLALVAALREKAAGGDSGLQTPELCIGTSTVLEILKFVLVAIVRRGEQVLADKERIIDRAFRVHCLMQLEGLDAPELDVVHDVLEHSDFSMDESLGQLRAWKQRQRISLL